MRRTLPYPAHPHAFFPAASQEDELSRMTAEEPAYRMFTALATASDLDEERLPYVHAGWAGEWRTHNVIPSVMRNVQTFVQMRPAVLHVDEVRAPPQKRPRVWGDEFR